MKIIKRTGQFVLLLVIAIILGSWGYTGHYKINYNAQLSYNQDMTQFYQWSAILAEHASDADERKQWDPDEAPKHYIDIDNYPEFIATGTIPQSLSEVIAAHGYSFVINQGILPWATVTAVDSLQACFERQDWEKAVLFAADLGHYIGDGHMPLHITKNYNGQYSGNNGIHGRYESDMINMYETMINYSGEPISVIDDVNQYVFNYLYNNYTFVDSVLAADDYAQALAGNTSSDYYYEKLWEKSHGFTVNLFRAASHRLAELIYTAWSNAGSPLMTTSFSPGAAGRPMLLQNFPNPVKTSTRITFYLANSSDVTLEVLNGRGQQIRILMNEKANTGEQTFEFNPAGLDDGIYYLILKAGERTSIKKMVILR